MAQSIMSDEQAMEWEKSLPRELGLQKYFLMNAAVALVLCGSFWIFWAPELYFLVFPIVYLVSIFIGYKNQERSYQNYLKVKAGQSNAS